MDKFTTNLLTTLRSAPLKWTNSRGAEIREINLRMTGVDPYGEIDRYAFDFGGPLKEGWEQYDTDQDAYYFGVWVNLKTRETLTYSEGDWTLVSCANDEILRAELAHAAEFYGNPPPAMVAIDTETGQVTEYYSKRPEVNV